MTPIASSQLTYRHRLPVRIMHWINALSLVVLFMSGLMIFNAHPALDWGKSSYTGRAPVFEIGARQSAGGELQGYMRIGDREFDTTGVLGVSQRADGRPSLVAFPSWLTVPGSYSLAAGRLWHFFFAWLLVLNGVFYVAYAIKSKHLTNDLTPSRTELRGIGQSIKDHLRFKHPQGDDARRYNVLQKLAYLVVIFVLLPLIILGGWAMSPWLNSFFPGWVDLLGGRQSARTIHFIVAWLLVGFVVIHVFEVFVSGAWNHLRSMVTGWFRVSYPAVSYPAPQEAKGEKHV